MLNTLAMLRAISCSICRVHRCILNAIMYFCKLLIFICDFLCNTKSLTEVCLLTRGQWISNNCNVFITMRLHIWPDYWDLKCHQTLWTSGPLQKRVGLEKLIELETMMRCALAPTGCRQQHSVSGLENVKMFFLCILFYVAICVETVLTIPWRELWAASGSCKHWTLHRVKVSVSRLWSLITISSSVTKTSGNIETEETTLDQGQVGDSCQVNGPVSSPSKIFLPPSIFCLLSQSGNIVTRSR